jgi:hypothetical protein
MNVECFLIVGKKKRAEPKVRRVTQTRPSLQPDEALIRLSLDLPDDTFAAPLITVPVEKRQVAVAVEVDEPL